MLVSVFYDCYMKSEFNISSKRRLVDTVCINWDYYRVSTLIEENPLLLWNAIHTKKKNANKRCISLVRTAYAKLKQVVSSINPDLVLAVEAEFVKKKESRKQYALVNRLRRDIESGRIYTDNTRFKKLQKEVWLTFYTLCNLYLAVQIRHLYIFEGVWCFVFEKLWRTFLIFNILIVF